MMLKLVALAQVAKAAARRRVNADEEAAIISVTSLSHVYLLAVMAKLATFLSIEGRGEENLERKVAQIRRSWIKLIYRRPSSGGKCRSSDRDKIHSPIYYILKAIYKSLK